MSNYEIIKNKFNYIEEYNSGSEKYFEYINESFSDLPSKDLSIIENLLEARLEYSILLRSIDENIVKEINKLIITEQP